jgi:hypothetical protein
LADVGRLPTMPDDGKTDISSMTGQGTPDGTRMSDKRRAPRLEVLKQIHGDLLVVDLPMTLLNISEGGFLMGLQQRVAIGDVHEFRFTPAGGDPLMRRARIVHLAPAKGPDVSFHVGAEFVDEGSEDHQEEMRRLLAVLQP